MSIVLRTEQPLKKPKNQPLEVIGKKYGFSLRLERQLIISRLTVRLKK
ncbi:MAG: hypothetical protein IJQ87_01285 [Clostridia bacterium]|nr:hypothetical protein [Clostridia bacterium]